MAELVVDQSNLPGVQEVCQCFAVLEDGALAHNLQEQEIEQYYNSNVERSQLVQSDLRVAKRLQDEEQQRAHMLHRQATQQLEEQDSEFARRMQADIQRRAEETRRREGEDEEIAKQIQEEEELRVCRLYEAQMTGGRETASAPPHSTQPAHLLINEEEELSDHASSPSPTTSDYEEEEYCESRRQVYGDHRDPGRRGPQAPPPRELRGRSPVRRDRRSSARLGSRTEPFTGGWGHVVRLIKNDMSEQGYLSCTSEDEPFEPVYRLEKILKRCQLNPGQSAERGEGLQRHHSTRDGRGKTWQEEQAGRAERSRPSEDSDGRRTRSESRRVKCCSRSCRDSRSGDAQRHVHFQDDSRHCNTHDVSRREYEGNHATSQAVWSHTVSSYPVNGRSQTCCPAANGDQYQLQPRGLEQGTRVRHVYRDVDTRASVRVANRTQSHEAAQQAYRVRHFINTPQHPVARVVVVEEEIEGPGSFRDQGRWEGKSCRAHREIECRADSLREERTWERREDGCYRGGNGRRRTWSEPWRGHEGDGSSTEDDEEVERERRRRRQRRREEKRARVLPQRTLSLWYNGRSPGAVPGLQRARVSLDLGDLEQVLLDEELARRLQAEEEELIRRDAPSISPSQERCPDGDFTVAQVAQDEEIAHYIQNQEMEGNQRPQALASAGWEEGGGTDPYDEGIDFERQRERLDSEGLLSPSEVCSPEFLPSGPSTMATQQQQFRNVAEDLDPTYQRKESVQTGENNPGACPVQASPAFVTPTKRHSDKGGRVKSREKKENAKPKEGCKQQ